MDIRDPVTRDALLEAAGILALAYQRYRRARRIEIEPQQEPDSVNGELANPASESVHETEVKL